MRLKIILMSSLVLPLCAAAYSVKGQVMDAVTAETNPGAVVRLFAPQDTVRHILYTVADSDGNFQLNPEKIGEYILKVSFTGTKEAEMTFSLSDTAPDLDLGTIPLYPEEETLQEVVVTGRRPVVQANGEKVTYNVTEDPAAGQKTAIELLRKVPMVTVDGQDNIRVNGSSNFQIYLNGKPNPMLSQNASLVLKSFPASMIQKIEVIMEPGAKYEAEGTGGILNIITETQDSGEGSMATVTLGGSNKNANASIYAITKRKNVTASLNLSYFNSRFNPQNVDDGTIERIAYNSDEAYKTYQKMKMSVRNQFINGALNLSWEPNAKNLFTLTGNVMYGWGTNTSDTYTSIFNRSGAFSSGFKQWLRTDWTWGNYSVDASYQHNFSGEGHNIVVSYQYQRGLNGNDNTTFDYDLENMSTPLPAQFNSKHSPANTNTLQLDYTLPFMKNYTFETGAKGIFRRNRGEGETIFADDLSSLDNSETRIESTVMKQYQDVSALYASLAGVWNKFNAKAGLRYEYTHMGVNFLKGDYSDFNSDLNDIVPNAAVGYSFSPVTSLRAAYQMRIRRPSVNELNPHQTSSYANSVDMGNPDLTSEKTHNVTLTFSDFHGKVGMNLVAGYNFSDNQIGRLLYVKDEILYQTYDNIGNMKEGSLGVFLNYRPTSLFTITLNGAVRYKDLKFAAEGLKNHGWTGNVGGDVSWGMPWKLLMNVYGGCSFGEIELQSKQSGFQYYGISLSRNFLKEDRLKISLNATNFIDGNFKVKVDSWSDTFRNKIKFNVPVWSVGVSLAYTFGGMNDSVKKTSAGIVNDDVHTSKGGGTPGIN